MENLTYIKDDSERWGEEKTLSLEEIRRRAEEEFRKNPNVWKKENDNG